MIGAVGRGGYRRQFRVSDSLRPGETIQDGVTVTTLTLPDAADFLKLHPDSLRKMAKSGKVPGRKIGKSWIFLLEDLVVWVRSGYAQPRQAPLVEVSSWQYSKEAAHGGLISQPRAESELDALLKRKKERKH